MITMKTSLRTKSIFCFLIVIITTGLVATWVGVHLIGNSIVREEQRKVEMDLNSAREIYQRKIDDVRNLIRITTKRYFIKDALQSKNIKELKEKLSSIRVEEKLDILTLTDNKGKVLVRTRNPQVVGDSQADDELVSKVLTEQKVVASTQVITRKELLKEGEDLAKQSHIKFIPTPKAKSTLEKERTDGMMIKVASPILDYNGNLIGVLYGGNLLNRNYEIVDKVKAIVYYGETYEGKDIGTATIFQKDLRISTNVEKSNGERAIGTRVSKEVYEQVLEKGNPWFGRAFVVNNWYITAYEPIKNIKDEVIGILYVGILEKKFVDLRKRTLLIFLGITVAGVFVSLIIAYLLTNRIIKPIKYLVSASKQIANGNLDARVKCNSKDEIGELGETFNFMAGSLKERDEKLREYAEQEMMHSERLVTLGQLAAGVAHEINNPLAVVMGRAEFLASEMGDADPIILKSIKTIEHESGKAASIVRKFLSFARQPEPKFELTDINKLLENSLTLASHQALIEKITIVKNINEKIPKILADPQQIQQVFINVILNAFQSMPGGGKLLVATGMKNGFVETKFTDTGSGIAKEDLNKIFDPFFTTKKRGTGLGLAISKNIIDKHSGTIGIESELNKGSIVIIKLPIRKKQE
ncbi:cache domain-containing protein [candidate division WOR-3 bacterium]|nr:cache domain-containing protein [candidate division WOR-3 bacterium]